MELFTFIQDKLLTFIEDIVHFYTGYIIPFHTGYLWFWFTFIQDTYDINYFIQNTHDIIHFFTKYNVLQVGVSLKLVTVDNGKCSVWYA